MAFLTHDGAVPFRAIFEHALEAILLCDSEGRYVDANPAACELTGYSRDELVGLTVGDLAAERAEAGESLSSFLRAGSMTGDFLVRRKDGAIVEVEFRAVADIVPTIHLSVMRDVTAQRHAERERARRDAQLQATVDIGRVALAGEPLEQILAAAMDGVAGQLGVPLVEVLRRSPGSDELVQLAGTGWPPEIERRVPLPSGGLARFVMDQDEPVVVDDLAAESRFGVSSQLIDLGVRSTIAVAIRAATEVWGVLAAHDRLASAFTEQDVAFLGTVANVVGLAIERRASEDEVRERERGLRLMLDQLPALLWTVDGDLRLTLAVGSGLSAFSGGSDLTGLSLPEIFGRDGSISTEAHQQALNGAVVRFEMPWGSGVWRAHIEPFRDRDGQVVGALGVALDVGETARARRDLEATLADLRRLDEERRRLLHESFTARQDERLRLSRELHDHLGQLLTSATLYVSSLELDAPEELLDRLGVLRAVIEEAMASTRTVVSSLRSSPERGDVPLTTLVHELASTLMSRHGLVIDVDAEGSCEPLPGEVVNGVYRIVQEALTNAVKHSRASSVSIVITRSEKCVRVLLEDDGVGFDVQAEKAAASGHGIASMRERADGLGGSVLVVSEVGTGTTVRLEVPLSGAPG